MPPHRRETSVTRIRAITVGLLIWLIFIVAWSGLLLNRSQAHFLEQMLAARANALAAGLSADSAVNSQILTQWLAQEPDAAYIMLWSDDGRVTAHTDPALVGTFLDERQYAALDANQSVRFSQLSPSPPSASVLEVTVLWKVQAAENKTPHAYLTLAFKQKGLDARFWEATRWLWLGTFVLAAVGAIFLTVGILMAFRHLDNSRQQIEQNARARNSLLTERGMLASVLAHEVRSPLTALRFNLHTLRTLLLTEDASGTRTLDLAERASREIDRLDRMLNDFLLRTQSTPPSEYAGVASVNTVIQEAVEFLSPALERQNIHVSLHLDDTKPRVQVNPDELRQVVLNLAANAQDAMPGPKGGTLAISTLSPSAGAPSHTEAVHIPFSNGLHTGVVTLLIRDSGPGIAPELQERIFEPFFSTKPNGSGLGLALVRRVVSGAGGTVFCESTPGQGTTFRVLLPSLADEHNA